jgi:hypothetical protein
MKRTTVLKSYLTLLEQLDWGLIFKQARESEADTIAGCISGGGIT